MLNVLVYALKKCEQNLALYPNTYVLAQILFKKDQFRYNVRAHTD